VLEVAPDGLDVFVTLGVDDAIVILRRDPANGALTMLPVRPNCGGRTSTPPCHIVSSGGLDDVALTPNGTRLFAIHQDAIIAYDRDPATGALTPVPWPGGCLTSNPVRGCRHEHRIDGSSGVVSPDGRFLYTLGLRRVNAYAVG
jgi:hypothetical protein